MKYQKKDVLYFALSIVLTAGIFFTAGAFTADFLELNRLDRTEIEYVPQTAPSSTTTILGEYTFSAENSTSSVAESHPNDTHSSENSTTDSPITPTSGTENSTSDSAVARSTNPTNKSKTVVYPTARTTTSQTASTTRTLFTTTTTSSNSAPSVVQSQSNPVTTASTKMGKINLNTATKEELMTVKGIGEVYATRILEHRERIGYFTCLEELLEVKGIGEKRLAQWAPYLTV